MKKCNLNRIKLKRNLTFLPLIFLLAFGCKSEGKGNGGDGNGDATKATLTITLSICGTVTNGDNTINCGNSHTACTADFGEGKSVTLSATADTGYVPGAWCGGCSGSGDCTLVMNADKTVSKAFTTSTGDSDNDCIPK